MMLSRSAGLEGESCTITYLLITSQISLNWNWQIIHLNAIGVQQIVDELTVSSTSHTERRVHTRWIRK